MHQGSAKQYIVVLHVEDEYCMHDLMAYTVNSVNNHPLCKDTPSIEATL